MCQLGELLLKFVFLLRNIGTSIDNLRETILNVSAQVCISSGKLITSNVGTRVAARRISQKVCFRAEEHEECFWRTPFGSLLN